MPTMLGLTKDPSPHGLNAKSGSLTATGSAHGHGSITGSASRNGGYEDDDSSSGEQQQQMQPYQHQRPPRQQQSKPLNNQGGNGPSKVDKDGKKKRLNTIGARNHASARTMDTLFWRAMCDSPTEVMEYMAEDVAVVSPLLFKTEAAIRREGTDDNPGLEEALENCGSFNGFRIDEIQTIESALMAVGSVYRVTLGMNGREVQAMCSSSWRQDAGADWYLCGMLIAKVN